MGLDNYPSPLPCSKKKFREKYGIPFIPKKDVERLSVGELLKRLHLPNNKENREWVKAAKKDGYVIINCELCPFKKLRKSIGLLIWHRYCWIRGKAYEYIFKDMSSFTLYKERIGVRELKKMREFLTNLSKKEIEKIANREEVDVREVRKDVKYLVKYFDLLIEAKVDLVGWW